MEFSVYKPLLILFCLVDGLQHLLKACSTIHTHTHTHTHTHIYYFSLWAVCSLLLNHSLFFYSHVNNAQTQGIMYNKNENTHAHTHTVEDNGSRRLWLGTGSTRLHQTQWRDYAGRLWQGKTISTLFFVLFCFVLFVLNKLYFLTLGSLFTPCNHSTNCPFSPLCLFLTPSISLLPLFVSFSLPLPPSLLLSFFLFLSHFFSLRYSTSTRKSFCQSNLLKRCAKS